MKQNDSTHEDYFEWWLEEAIQAGLVISYERPEPFIITPKQVYDHAKVLKSKTVITQRTLFHPHTYKPDFKIVWKNPHLHCDILTITSENEKHFISQDSKHPFTFLDIKPDRIGPRMQNSAHTFPFNQKMMYDKFGIYVQKVILYPASNTQGKNRTLFTETWTPKKLLEHPDWKYKKDCKFGLKGESRIKWECRTVEEFISLAKH